MTLPPDVVRNFSEDLRRIHAATSNTELADAVAHAEDRCPMAWLAVLVREHAGERREQLRGTRPDAGLTPREHQVLERVARGDTDAAAGRALGIATRTVSKHVEAILRKLGVETRTAAVRQVARRSQ